MAEKPKHQDERWLREKYVANGKTVPEIADDLGISVTILCRWMDRYGIERGRGPTPDNTDYRDAEWLHDAYWGRGLNVREIANRCDVSVGTISRWLDKHGIETRDRGGTTPGGYNPMQDASVVDNHPITGTSGKNHPFFKGEPDGWRKRQPWTDIRKDVIARDDGKCFICGMTREEHFNAHGQDLDVHHIVPTSEGGRRFAPDNLVTLCRPCHSDTHAERNQSHEATTEPNWPTPETAEYGG